MTREKFSRSLKVESKYNEYMKSLGEFEALFNETEPSKQLRHVSDKISLPSWVYAEETEGTVGHTNLGIFLALLGIGALQRAEREGPQC